MKLSNLISMILVLAPTHVLGAVGVVVPNGAENQEGNDATIWPFLIGIGGSARYQQVYHAS